MAGIEIDAVHLSMAGPHIKGFNSRGVIAVAGKSREITRDDVRRAIEAAKAVSLPAGREILHVLPQDFVVDEQDGIGAPVGMTGARLEVNVHIVTGAPTATQNLVACVNRAGVGWSTPWSNSRGRRSGVDAGREGARRRAGRHRRRHDRLRHLRARQPVAHRGDGVGGDHFTNDIAVGLRMPIPDAEKLKRQVRLRAVGDGRRRRDHRRGERGGRRSRVMARRILSEILQPRAEEIFHLVWDEIRRAGYEKSLNSGIVLTGGGAILEGMPEIAEQISTCRSGAGRPPASADLPTSRQSAFATAVGLCSTASGIGSGRRGAPTGVGAFGRVGGPATRGCSGSSSRQERSGHGRGGYACRRTRISSPLFKDMSPSELRLKLDEPACRGAHQSGRRRRGRQQCRRPHGAEPGLQRSRVPRRQH